MTNDPILIGPDIDLIKRNYTPRTRFICLWSLDEAYPDGRLRYHLGQLCMLNFVNRLANESFRVSFIICDPWHQKLSNAQTEQVSRNTTTTRQFLEHLRDGSIQILEMSGEISRMQEGQRQTFEGIRRTARDGFTLIADFIKRNPLSNNLRSEVSVCRAYGDPFGWPRVVQEYASHLAEEFPNVPQQQLMAAICAATRSPKWFNSDWMGEVCAWLVMTNESHADQVIIEANRGAYSWMTHKCLLNVGLINSNRAVGDYGTPSNCFIHPVMSTDGTGAMELKHRGGCVFIDSEDSGVLQQISGVQGIAKDNLIAWLRCCGRLGSNTDDFANATKEFLSETRHRIAPLLKGQGSSHDGSKSNPHVAAIPVEMTKRPVVSVHGIRTHAPWQKTLTNALSKGHFPHFPYDFGRFNLLKFAWKRSREKVIKKFLAYYTQRGFSKSNPPSVVAHSFGTYVICRALSDHLDIYFHNVILLGSIVVPDFNWSAMFLTGRINAVLNEISEQDGVIGSSKWIVSDSGASGTKGFSDLAGGKVIERRHKSYKHSDALNELAFETSWQEFLQNGKL